jgi:hypothetical protein
MSLPTLNAEERQALLEKGRLAKIAKKAFAEANLKLSYQDDIYWNTKSAELGIRLPQKHAAGAKGVRKTAKALGVDIKLFLESTGCSNLNELCALNPTWNSRSLASLVMEYYLDTQ